MRKSGNILLIIIFASTLAFMVGSAITGHREYWLYSTNGKYELTKGIYEYALEEGNEREKQAIVKTWGYNYNVGLIIGAATGLFLSIILPIRKYGITND